MPVDLIGVLVFGASMIGTPGPANMIVMASGARFGFVPSLPFLSGVIFGKQLIIWPLGLGLIGVLDPDGPLFLALKVASLAYVLWLAWKIAGTRITKRNAGDIPPRFAEGLIVHPLNPKAWALILGSYTAFADPAASALTVTAIMAAVFLGLQIVLQSMWTLIGARIASLVAGTQREVWLMRGLGTLMVASVAYAIFRQG